MCVHCSFRVCSVIVQALAAYARTKAALAEVGMRAIANLTETSEVNRRMLGEAGVCAGNMMMVDECKRVRENERNRFSSEEYC